MPSGNVSGRFARLIDGSGSHGEALAEVRYTGFPTRSEQSNEHRTRTRKLKRRKDRGLLFRQKGPSSSPKRASQWISVHEQSKLKYFDEHPEYEVRRRP